MHGGACGGEPVLSHGNDVYSVGEVKVPAGAPVTETAGGLGTNAEGTEADIDDTGDRRIVGPITQDSQSPSSPWIGYITTPALQLQTDSHRLST